ncbi:OmpA family protein [Pedobacter sp. MW01-1-1]|uniref:OmpA family protein n=1 Tax=Pedobacter sp. MW01-1-1 TaxID=3383027 RepID=UPI003FF042D2
MKKLILFLLVSCGQVALAQHVVDYKKVADAYFENHNYYAASTFYKKALKIEGDTLNPFIPYASGNNSKTKQQKMVDDYEGAVYNLAESSRLYKEHSEAEKYYAYAVKFTNTRFRKAPFYYAESLRANKKFSEAISYYKSYESKYPNDSLTTVAQSRIASCQFAIDEMNFPRMTLVQKMPTAINGLGANYAAAKNGYLLYFTSSRPLNVVGQKDVKLNSKKGPVQVTTKTNPYINSFYIAQVKDLNSAEIEVKKMPLSVGQETEVATPTFNPQGTIMYFTVKNAKNKYDIYQAKKVGDEWGTPVKLGPEINGDVFNATQPFVTNEGKYLLFSSDKPGGFGKYDLYYSVIRQDGVLSQAINMGSSINTKDNESTPFFDSQSGELLFSCDGRIGLGGFDFFSSKGNFETWTEPKNVGYPFNSSKDDLYFSSEDGSAKKGYISSDRESACCLEIFAIDRKSFVLQGTIIDCKTKAPLEGATVTFIQEETITKIQTNATGKYSFQFDRKKPVKMLIAKDNYFAIRKEYSYQDLAQADTMIAKDYCIEPFKVDVPIVIDNVYYEFNKADLTDASKTVLDGLFKIMEDNPEIEIELGAHTDDIGSDIYNLDLSQRRAKSCVDYLISKNIAANRMVAKGYGESKPIAANKTPKGKDNPDGRAKNRRTEFKVTKK